MLRTFRVSHAGKVLAVRARDELGAVMNAAARVNRKRGPVAGQVYSVAGGGRYRYTYVDLDEGAEVSGGLLAYPRRENPRRRRRACRCRAC